jgi:cyanamide hydratase family protein with HD domain
MTTVPLRLSERSLNKPSVTKIADRIQGTQSYRPTSRTCHLHDLGTTPTNMHGTHMSFEYYGAFKALNFLRDNGAPADQTEAVSEAIIRHADLGETGTLTSLGMLIQLSTVFGKSPLLVCSIIPKHCLQIRGQYMTHHLRHILALHTIGLESRGPNEPEYNL